MRILSVVTRSYCGHPHALEPMFLEFTHPLLAMGHVVEHFDHVRICSEVGPSECGAQLVDAVRCRGYDLVLYQTGGRDFVTREAIPDAAKHAPIIAWNSDDDWQWESYSRHLAPLFTFMITTYPHVYEGGRREHRNLLLSQWGCLETHATEACAKDIDFSFVGQVYRNRVAELRALRRRAGLRVFGLGALRVSCPPFNNARFRQTAATLFPSMNRAMAFGDVQKLWNRTRISYTPLGASTNPNLLQIKGRVFQMGLSGTMMLCQNAPQLAAYYTPGREYITFDGLDDCVEKTAHYLANEAERRKIAAAYAARTRAEHLWSHRFEEIFRMTGFARARRMVA